MTKQKLSKFNERFYSIDASLRKEVISAIGNFELTKNEKALTDKLTFTLGSDYYHKMADLCFEMLKALKIENAVQLPNEPEEEW